MSYLNDPNTRRLATNCVACGRALRDAKSVTVGMGPHCRKQYGYADAVSGLSEEQRTQANQIIHKAGIASDTNDVPTIVACADEVEKLGMTKIADIMRTRYIKIRLERASNMPVYAWDPETGTSQEVAGKTRDVIRVFTPYGSPFNDVRKNMRLRMRPVYKTKKNGVLVPFHWEAGVEQGHDVLKCLARAHGGEMAFGDKGVFQIPGGAS